MVGWNHSGVFKEKPCVVCGTLFKPKSGVNKFCSPVCKGKWQYITGRASTENQYKEISGNWKRYCSRLIYRGSRKRDQLTVDIILEKLVEQKYKCALSGLPLQCFLEKGSKSLYNVSIDRIEAGGPYTKENIQLVCVALNRWRADTSVDDFVKICKAVAENFDQRRLETENGC